MVFKGKLPRFIKGFLTLALVVSLCTSLVYATTLTQDLLKWQDEANILKNELDRINRYSEYYQTTPENVATVLRETELHGVSPNIMLELIKVESNYNPNAISPKGAEGLCQIIPSTAREICRDLGLTYDPQMLKDPETNIKFGTYYLSKLLKEVDNEYHKALTYYNRGPVGLQALIQRTGSPVSAFSTKITNNSNLEIHRALNTIPTLQ